MSKLSIQLYSARKFPPVEKQLETVAAAGYRYVETFGPFYDDVGATQKLFERFKVTAPSGHVSLDMADGQRERTRDMAKALGMSLVITPHIMPDQRPSTASGWAELGLRLQRLSDYYAGLGLTYAWHNHDFEFNALPDGSLPIEHILGGGLAWQADLAWIRRGKADPVKWLNRYAGRVKSVHVKDDSAPGERADEDGWADPGAGVLPWKDYWAAAKKAGAEVMTAEHDNPKDFARFANAAMKTMKTLEGA
jgi:sugar phosphate isomerase/epimerase